MRTVIVFGYALYENFDYAFKHINDSDLLKFENLNFLSHEVASNSFKLKTQLEVTARIVDIFAAV